MISHSAGADDPLLLWISHQLSTRLSLTTGRRQGWLAGLAAGREARLQRCWWAQQALAPQTQAPATFLKKESRRE